MPRKYKVPEPHNGVEARTLIWAGVGFFFTRHPLKMWPLALLLIGSNGTAWYKALFDDTVTLKPVGESGFSVIERAYASEKFVPDTNWVILKHHGRYEIRAEYKPTGAAFDIELPALQKIEHYKAGK